MRFFWFRTHNLEGKVGQKMTEENHDLELAMLFLFIFIYFCQKSSFSIYLPLFCVILYVFVFLCAWSVCVCKFCQFNFEF